VSATQREAVADWFVRDEANWLVGMQDKPERPLIAHFIFGTSDLPVFENNTHSEIWLNEAPKCYIHHPGFPRFGRRILFQ
jgi:hypothetical protein